MPELLQERPKDLRPLTKSGGKEELNRQDSFDAVAHARYISAMKDAVIRARIDEALKNDAERVLGRIGLSTTEAIRMFLTQVTLHKGIPFPIAAPGSPLDVVDILHPAEKRNAVLDMIDDD